MGDDYRSHCLQCLSWEDSKTGMTRWRSLHPTVWHQGWANSNAELNWNCRPEHLYVASKYAWAFSQHGIFQILL